MNVLMVSRLLRSKGVLEYGACAGHLNGAARFALVGGIDYENPQGLSLREVEELRVTVTLMGHLDDVRPALEVADVVVLPCLVREGLPLALIEAAAMGKPLVASDVPGCREIVQHGVNGLLVPPGNVGALTGAIRLLLADPVIRERMGRASRRLAVEVFDADKVAEAHLALYRRVS